MSVQSASTPTGYPPLAPANLSPVRSYGVGMWAWLAQRVTGVLLVVVVFAHFWAKVLAPSWGLLPRITDVAMIALVCYHSFNGIRTVLVDLGYGLKAQRTVFWVLVLLGLATALAALRAYQVRFF